MKFKNPFSRTEPQPTEKEILTQDLKKIQRQIHQVNLLYNLTDDPELIDCYIYELQSLQKQYNFLLYTYKQSEKEKIKRSNVS